MRTLVQAQPRRNAAHGRLALVVMAVALVLLLISPPVIAWWLALLAVVCLVLAVRDRGRRRPPQDQLDKINNTTVNGMRRTS